MLYPLSYGRVGASVSTGPGIALPHPMWKPVTLSAGMIAALLLLGALVPAHSGPRLEFATPWEEATLTTSPERAGALRLELLKRARVWQPTDPASVNFTRNPNDPSGWLSGPIVNCRFIAHASGGTTRKFRCALPSGEVVKVKYGHTGEVHAELAASRLVRALGFGADDMHIIERVRCYGCPREPYYALWVLDRLRATDTIADRLPQTRYTDFEWVSVERRFDGAAVEAGDTEGWAWYELAQIDPAHGASRAEVDAFRITAALLAHWDNKAQNQRLVCRAEGETRAAVCQHPWAIMQDLGATFGPNKVDLDAWSRTPVWADAASCRLSMKSLPYGGSTFTDIEVTESGRQLLLRQLEKLNPSQVQDLFTAARFREFARGRGRAADPVAWRDAFLDKIEQIRQAGPCRAA